MFDELAKLVPKDPDYPDRVHTIDVLTRVLKGEIYDTLQHEFADELTQLDEYIPIRKRKPSVRTGIIRTVVDDSISLLFSEGHFPEIDCQEEPTKDALKAITKDAALNLAMIDGATRGSVGSVAMLLQFLSSRVFLTTLDTRFLTPTWNPKEPDQLLKVTERYKVSGDMLRRAGYAIRDIDLSTVFWFQREWDANAETWFVPVKVSEDDPKPYVDTKRTVKHSLGFVPVVWVRNLPGGDAIDGSPTFSKDAICTVIEADYQLSQAGRGLKYSQEPTLVIKDDDNAAADRDGGRIVRSASNAIKVGSDGDAKLLEIEGTAAEAVIRYVEKLRDLAIESMHGNRSNADKLSAAQSGRALELMHQALIWLADRLRASYGEGALLSIYRMIVRGSQRYPIIIRGKTCPMSAAADLSLKWPAWFPPTAADLQSLAAALAGFISAGTLSRQTATTTIAAIFDIEDVAAEQALVVAERKALIAELPTPQSKVNVNE